MLSDRPGHHPGVGDSGRVVGV